MTDEAGRERLRRTFESAAARYQRARPEYPAALYDDLLATTARPPGGRILEVGCATGKATLPLARRGFGVTCIELGPDLARAARAKRQAPGTPRSSQSGGTGADPRCGQGQAGSSAPGRQLPRT